MPRSPLVGHNTAIAHRGRAFHVQTEDSGLGHPHVITHVFADGGRIVATQRTDYGEIVDTDDCAATVRALIRAQHDHMSRRLRDGGFDVAIDDASRPIVEAALALTNVVSQSGPAPPPIAPSPPSPPRRRTSDALSRIDPMSASLDEIILADLAALAPTDEH